MYPDEPVELMQVMFDTLQFATHDALSEKGNEVFKMMLLFSCIHFQCKYSRTAGKRSSGVTNSRKPVFKILHSPGPIDQDVPERVPRDLVLPYHCETSPRGEW
jgi:hypothetical protein